MAIRCILGSCSGRETSSQYALHSRTDAAGGSPGVVGTDLRGRDVRGDGEHRGATAVGVVEPLHEVRVPRAAAAGAHREPAGELRLGGGREGAGLLVVHVHPLDVGVAPDRVGQRVQAVPDQPVHPADAGLHEHLDHLVGNRLAHGSPPTGPRVVTITDATPCADPPASALGSRRAP
jgi:hypothetical protein